MIYILETVCFHCAQKKEPVPDEAVKEGSDGINTKFESRPVGKRYSKTRPVRSAGMQDTFH